MNKPEFFIIGAPKCGTTSLYTWLKDHPDIFMPEAKEPHYFAQNLSDRYCRIRDEDEYLSLFNAAKNNQTCGEASVLYAFFPDTIKRVLQFNSEAKFIYMVRNPVAMAQSYHGQLLVNLEEDVKDFEKAWELQEDRVRGDKLPPHCQNPQLLIYRDICALGHHLEAIQKIVPKTQLHVISLDDLGAQPEQVYSETLKFLSVQNNKHTDFSRVNEKAAIKSRTLEKLRKSNSPLMQFSKRYLKKILPKDFVSGFNRTQRKNNLLSKKFKETLLETFKYDIKVIENFLDKDLSSWRGYNE